MNQPLVDDLESLPFFFLRTPALPFDDFFDFPLLENKTALALQWWQMPEIQEAIWIASNRLYEKINLLFQNPPSTPTKEQEKLLLTLLKYVLRMKFRCTPFGTFAGLSKGVISQKTSLKISAIGDHRAINPDTVLLHEMYESLLDDFAFLRCLHFFPNNTIYPFLNTFRFLFRQRIGDDFKFWVETAPSDDSIKLLMDVVAEGASFDHLLKALVASGKTIPESEQLIHELVQKQLLVPSILPSLNTATFQAALVNTFAQLPKTSPAAKYATFLNQLKGLSAQVNQGSPIGKMEAYQMWAKNDLQREMPPTECASKRIQIDWYKKMSNGTLSKAVVAELKRATSFLMRLPMRPSNQHLEEFITCFYERYGEGEVSLAALMDADLGIGYPLGHFVSTKKEALMEGLPFRTNSKGKFAAPENSPWEDFLLKKYISTVQQKEKVLQLSDAEVNSFFVDDQLEWATTLYAGAIVFAESEEALDQQDFNVFYLKMGGHSAARLVGRFSELHPAIGECVESIKLKEEEAVSADYILAEIVHTPRAKSGNLGRRVDRGFTIPLFDNGGSENVLLWKDIMVSVKNNRVRLRSKKWNKWIKPYLTNAINPFFRTIPPFHFLGELTTQNIRDHVAWAWGKLAALDFLPRVVYGKTILAKAKWKIHRSDFSKAELGEVEVFLVALKQYRKEKNIPSIMVLLERNQQIPLHLDALVGVEMLWQELKKRDQVVLEECLFEQKKLFIKDARGKKYTNEFVFPFQYTQKRSPSSKELSAYERPLPQLSFNPDADWLSVHVFCGPALAAHSVLPQIAAFAEAQVAAGVIDRWFFIRFPNPWHHLRIRFHQKKGQRSGALFSGLREVLKECEVWKWELVPYTRELQRYGASNIGNMEALFYYDSATVTALHSLALVAVVTRPVWLTGIIGACLLMEDFGLSMEQRISLLKYAKESFAKELQGEKGSIKKRLNAKLLDHRAEIDLIINKPFASLSPEEQKCFAARSKRNQPIIHKIKSLEEAGDLPLSYEKLCGTCMHLFFNRLFKAEQRKKEAVIYDFLYKRYFSLTKR